LSEEGNEIAPGNANGKSTHLVIASSGLLGNRSKGATSDERVHRKGKRGKGGPAENLGRTVKPHSKL